ncbi:hypothetical protein CICLE_v10004582mg [Citrus x clementina]|uniref:BED-type domain-containing protein n=2 Tax=Citrus clementina TaxID=85681 RepID=V4SBD0_CITCL|nr:hypothetical protein CICLE_v10004582mg [Citrus x clementina]
MAQTREPNACLEPSQNHDNEILNQTVENSSRTKRRKLTSKVWDEFTKFQGKNGKVWAKCRDCNGEGRGGDRSPRTHPRYFAKKGTTHLNNHAKRCRSSKNNEENGGKLADHYNENGNSTNPAVLKGKFVINQELNQLGVIRSIIKYGFSNLNLIKSDILLVYAEEKEKLRKYLTKLSCRFNLAIRFEDGCSLMALHFIDDNWELKQKFISFHGTYDSFHGMYDYFCTTFTDVLSDWNVKKKIRSVVVNLDSEKVNEKVSSWMTEQGLVPFVSPLLSSLCLADFLESYCWNRSNREADKIRKAFDYIRKPANKHKFQMAIERGESMGKKVISRPLPEWLHGLNELETAVGYKEAFWELEVMDYEFKLINLAKEEWDKATAVYEYLKILNGAAQRLSDTKYTTANVFFPKVCELYLKFLLWERADEYFVREIATGVKERFFSKYWLNYKLYLAAAIVLDPRYKLDIVDRWYTEIYGTMADVRMKEIVDVLTHAYNKYAHDNCKMLDEMGRPCTSSSLQNSELVLYLKVPKIPPVEEFDVLAWRRLNSPIFPTLAIMARDFLAIPISAAAFKEGADIENIHYCSGLDVDVKRAVICTKSWLESSEY